MTKKDYELVAVVIASYPAHSPSLRAARASFANSFAERFEQVNPRFNREIFAKACGLETWQGHIVNPR